MTASPFATFSPGMNAPAIGSFVITPGPSDLYLPIRQITIGTAEGTILYLGWDGLIYGTDNLPVGTYPLFATRILATGTAVSGSTTATSAVGLTGWV